jgi:hypothetical protein
MTGTAAEVTPLREVDDQPIGPPGPVTLAIQQGVPGHGARAERALVALARVRDERAGARAGVTEATREIPLSRRGSRA